MRTRRTAAAALCLAALAVIGVLALRSDDPATSPHTVVAAASPEGVNAEQLEKVQRVIDERNAQAGEERRVFERDGWEIVSAPAPDPRVTDIDPALLTEGREPELRLQLASTTPAVATAHNVAQVVLMAKEEATREAAALALGRMRSPRAQQEILDLLTRGGLEPGDLARDHLVSLLRPVDLDDEIAARMADLLGSDAMTAAEKKQIAFSLALIGLRDGMELPEPVLATMSPESLALLAQMKDLGARSFLALGHKHAH
jgi:hypothetical protein